MVIESVLILLVIEATLCTATAARVPSCFHLPHAKFTLILTQKHDHSCRLKKEKKCSLCTNSSGVSLRLSEPANKRRQEHYSCMAFQTKTHIQKVLKKVTHTYQMRSTSSIWSHRQGETEMESVPIGLRVGEKQLVEQMGFEKEEEEKKKKQHTQYIFM